MLHVIFLFMFLLFGSCDSLSYSLSGVAAITQVFLSEHWMPQGDLSIASQAECPLSGWLRCRRGLVR